MSIVSGSIPAGTAPFRADPLKTSPPAKSTLAPVFSGLSGFPVIFGPTRSKSRAHITGAPRPALFTVLARGPPFDGPPLEQAPVALSRMATAQWLPFFQHDCDTRPPLATLLYIPLASRREPTSLVGTYQVTCLARGRRGSVAAHKGVEPDATVSSMYGAATTTPALQFLTDYGPWRGPSSIAGR